MLNFMKVLTQKKYHEHVPCSYAFKVACIDGRFSKPIVLYRGKNATYEFIKINQLSFIEVKMLLMNLLKQFLMNISTVRK